MKIDLKGIFPIEPKLPDKPEYISGPVMIGVVSHDYILVPHSLRHETKRMLIVVSDNTSFSLNQILENVKVPVPYLVKRLSDEVELMMYDMNETAESRTKDFISEKQKEYWLKERMNKPNKHYTTTRNKMK